MLPVPRQNAETLPPPGVGVASATDPERPRQIRQLPVLRLQRRAAQRIRQFVLKHL